MRRYDGDPRWLVVRYAGTDDDGRPYRRGDEVLFFPRSRKIYTGARAAALWREFQAAAWDEAIYGGQHV